MRSVPMKKIVLASTLATAACGLPLATFLASSVSAPRASFLGDNATVSPFAMMVKAPLNLPVERYDAH